MIKSCGIVVYRKENDTHKYLLMRSYSFVDLGTKGKQDKGETDFETALREAEEEASLTTKDLTFPFGQISFETEKYKKNSKFVKYFIAETVVKDIKLPINPELGKPEHDDYYWMGYEQAHKTLIPRLQKVLEWAENLIQNEK